MTKKLEEILNLPPLEDDDDFNNVPEKTKEEILAESATITNALSVSEKIDASLTTVTGLLEHDSEMDEIAQKALESYQEICSLSMNVADIHVSKLYEVASNMLRTAMEARDAKVRKKLRIIDLQIKKLRLDKIKMKDEEEQTANQVEFDRNELLKHLIDNRDNN